MSVLVDIPKNLQQQLEAEWGDLPRAAKEALAVESYRAGKLSLGQVAELLGLSINQADGFLKQRGIALPLSYEDFEHDRAELRKTLKK